MFKIENQVPFFDKMSPNQQAVTIGCMAEAIACEVMGWEKKDADGFDAVAEEEFSITLGQHCVRTELKKVKIEIKSISNYTSGNIVSYSQEKKSEKYDYMAVYYWGDKHRLSIIPHDLFDPVGKTLNFNPGLRHNHSKPVYSDLTRLFIKYEVEDFNSLVETQFKK